jgi:hypothetical protein
MRSWRNGDAVVGDGMDGSSDELSREIQRGQAASVR